ncbi:MAG: ATP-grasp domain-containing protein [Deltaproteobacteria bacterium]|nr:ATP-grasp domain-containing protein [Deltaproteobacteria bacterium]
MKKIMVANRGEPVIRAVKTFRRMAIATAVVYAPEDAGAAWLSEVDYAFPLSASAPGTRSLYLDGEQILAIARANGCDAIWPAWGFLAEDAAFAESVIKAGIGWIGPAPAAMRRLGSKAAATALAKDAGVPTIPEVVVAPDEPKIAQAAKAIGYPLLLKPALGGGGQGQVVVQRPEDLAEAYALASRINSAQFQNGPILFQRYLEAARHIEVQVLSDAHDTLITFHERDCSIQRRNQKIIEESPSPALTPSQRAALQGHARRLATAAGYTSAGTIEFLFADGEFFFLEINTRLQVEHPVTEESTRWIAEGGRWRRIDLLEEMVRIARGERLRFTQETVRCIGHAVEARIYAEDPARDFHPAPGTISHLRFPVGDRFRVETALRGPGGTVESLYDPMLAKLITWGSTREAALAQLRQGLHRTTIGGVTTNLAFLARVVAESEFAAGTYSTAYVRQHPALCQMPRDNAGLAMTVAAIALYERDRVQALQRLMSGHVTNVAAVLWAVPPNGGEYCCTLFGRRATLRVAEWSPGRYLVEAQGASLGLRGVRTATDEVVLLLPDGATCAAGLTWQADRVDVALHGATYAVEWSAAGTARAVDPHAAPGGGRLVKICVAPGQMVQAGDILYITEAMKMEARIAAAFAGTVTALHAAPGTAVEPGQSILTVVREEIAQTAGTDEENDWTAEDLCAPVLRESVGSSDVVKLGDAVECIRRYFQGYDSSRDAVLLAAEQASAAVASGVGTAEQLAECLADCATAYRVLTTLFSEDHAHATIYFVEHVGVRERRLPKQTEDLLCELAQIAGFPDLRDRPMLRHAVLHWLQASRYHMEAYQDVLLVLFSSWVKKSRCDGLRLRAAVRALVDARIIQRAGAARQRWREVLRDYDWEAYYAVEMPPVAREYWDLYEQYLADPLSGIAPRMLDKMRAAVAAVRMLSPPDPAGPRRPLGRGSWPGLSTEAATWLAKWFDGDSIQSLPVSRAAAEAGVRLFVSTIPIRLIAAAILPQTAGAEQGAAPATLPIVERAAIESYWMLRAYRTLGLEGELNHVFLFLPESFAVSDLPAGTTRQVARRVAGFARRLRIAATEVVVSIAGERRLVQIWHAREVGVVSRPPMALAEFDPWRRLAGLYDAV